MREFFGEIRQQSIGVLAVVLFRHLCRRERCIRGKSCPANQAKQCDDAENRRPIERPNCNLPIILSRLSSRPGSLDTSRRGPDNRTR